MSTHVHEDRRVPLISHLELAPGMRVLDAGYGIGALLPGLVEAVGPTGEVVGIDTGEHLAEHFPSQVRELVDRGAVTLRRDDAQALPDADGSFDAAWMSAVLHHVIDPARAVRELARVVRPGGIVAIMDADEIGCFPFLPWPAELDGAVRTAVARAAVDGYGGRLPYTFHGLIGRSIPGLMRDAGLTEVVIHPIVEQDQFPLGPDQAESIRGFMTGAYLERIAPYLAPDDRDAFLARFGEKEPSEWLMGREFFMIRTSLLVTGRRPAEH